MTESFALLDDLQRAVVKAATGARDWKVEFEIFYLRHTRKVSEVFAGLAVFLLWPAFFCFISLSFFTITGSARSLIILSIFFFVTMGVLTGLVAGLFAYVERQTMNRANRSRKWK